LEVTHAKNYRNDGILELWNDGESRMIFRGNTIKYLKIFTFFLLFLFLWLSSTLTLMAEVADSAISESENQEKNSKINQALIWNSWGSVHYKNKNYSAAIDCFLKALELNPTENVYMINLSRAYFSDKQFEKAYLLLNKTLNNHHSKKDRKKFQIEMANIHFWWAKHLQKEHDHANAISHYEKALIFDKIHRPKNFAYCLNNIGFSYYRLGEKQKALQYFLKALSVRIAIGDKEGEAVTLNNIGMTYTDFGERQIAMKYFKEALPVRRAIGDKEGEAVTLNNIGALYASMDQTLKAMEFYNKSLAINEAMNDLEGRISTMHNIAALYGDMGKKYKALEFYKKTLPILRSLDNRYIEATTLNNIGYLYNSLGNNQKALEYYNQALHSVRGVGNKAGEAITLHNIGLIYLSLNKNSEAMVYFEKALPMHRMTNDQSSNAKTLGNLMTIWGNLEVIHLAIFYGKQAVNLFQKLRAGVASLENKFQKKFLEKRIDVYRWLAEFLITEGRLTEARQVLDMMKEEGCFEFIRRDASWSSNLITRVDFTEFEKEWLEKHDTIIENLSIIGSEFHILKLKKNKNDVQKKRLVELNLKLKNAQRDYKSFLIRLKDAFIKRENEKKKNSATIILVKEASELQNTLNYLDKTQGGKNAALHYLVHEGRVSVILTTPSSQSVKQTEINELELNVMILNYRNLVLKLGKIKRGVYRLDMGSETVDELFQKKEEVEKKLYQVIFKPIDEELKKYGATNLIISLDGVLRYIPLTAMWDGESFLVQRYRIALITPSSLKNIRDLPVKEKKILGLGASRGGNGFLPLPYVRREIRSIVKDEDKGYDGLIKGKAFIDDDFTKETMVNQLKNKRYPLVHISSHFKFSPGDETKNHLLLGDGTTMKLSEIRRMGKLFDNVKLLVLSACETGIGGNGEEIDGFGELAQQSGAKSVIASLWPVADESTKELMVAFYRKLKEGKITSKIEALRQAQLELAGLEDLLGKDKHKIHGSTRSKTKYSSSYFWGPFIMIGNWR
jgi:CHAT domain-containing protein/Tfp pilus assembly protein PilF/preprotein translocase subunit SecG